MTTLKEFGFTEICEFFDLLGAEIRELDWRKKKEVRIYERRFVQTKLFKPQGETGKRE